jgi:senataxin
MSNHSIRIASFYDTGSLSTIHREYAALASLPYYDFADMILRPKLAMPPVVNPKDVQNAMITYSINEPQAKAILSSLESSGFCLVQGQVVHDE